MAAVISETRGREARRISAATPNLALEAMPVLELVFVADKRTSIKKARVCYLTAAAVVGSAYGVNIQIGTFAHPNKFTVHTSAASKAAGQHEEVSFGYENFLEAGDWLVVRTGFGKTGGGTVVVHFELSEVE